MILYCTAAAEIPPKCIRYSYSMSRHRKSPKVDYQWRALTSNAHTKTKDLGKPSKIVLPTVNTTISQAARHSVTTPADGKYADKKSKQKGRPQDNTILVTATRTSRRHCRFFQRVNDYSYGMECFI